MDDTQKSDLLDTQNVDYLETPSPGAEAALFKNPIANQESFPGGGEENRRINTSVLSHEIQASAQKDTSRLQQLRSLLGRERGEKRVLKPSEIRTASGKRVSVMLSDLPTPEEVREALRNAGEEELAEHVHRIVPTNVSVKDKVTSFLDKTLTYLNKKMAVPWKKERWVYTSVGGESVDVRLPKKHTTEHLRKALIKSGRADLAAPIATRTPHQETKNK